MHQDLVFSYSFHKADRAPSTPSHVCKVKSYTFIRRFLMSFDFNARTYGHAVQSNMLPLQPSSVFRDFVKKNNEVWNRNMEEIIFVK